MEEDAYAVMITSNHMHWPTATSDFYILAWATEILYSPSIRFRPHLTSHKRPREMYAIELFGELCKTAPVYWGQTKFGPIFSGAGLLGAWSVVSSELRKFPLRALQNSSGPPRKPCLCPVRQITPNVRQTLPEKIFCEGDLRAQFGFLTPLQTFI